MTRWSVFVPFDEVEEVDAETREEAAKKFLDTWPHEINRGFYLYVTRPGCLERYVLDLRGESDAPHAEEEH